MKQAKARPRPAKPSPEAGVTRAEMAGLAFVVVIVVLFLWFNFASDPKYAAFAARLAARFTGG